MHKMSLDSISNYTSEQHAKMKSVDKALGLYFCHEHNLKILAQQLSVTRPRIYTHKIETLYTSAIEISWKSCNEFPYEKWPNPIIHILFFKQEEAESFQFPLRKMEFITDVSII